MLYPIVFITIFRKITMSMNKLELKDINFIKDMSPEFAEMIMDVCKISIDDTYKAINSPDSNKDKLIQDLNEARIDEMSTFYNSLIDIFVEQELYEYCSKILDIVDFLQKTKEKVVSH